MKTIKHYFLSAIFFLQTISAFALYIDSVSIFSINSGTDSSRFTLVAKVHLGSSSCDLRDVNISDLSVDSLRVVLCYTGGTGLAVCHRLDSIDLGIRKNGVVNFSVIFREATNIQCSNFIFKKDTFYFTFNANNNSIVPLHSDVSFDYFPNPTFSTITITSSFTHLTTLQIFSLESKAVTGAIPVTANKQEVDIAFLPPGIYLAVLQSDRERVVKKFVKE